MSSTPGDGGVRWNDETQRWETADDRAAQDTSPTLPPPAYDAATAPEGTGSEEPYDRTYEVTYPPGPIPRPRRRTPLIVGAVVAVLAGCVVGGLLVVRDDDTGADSAGGGVASTAGTSGPGPEDGASQSPDVSTGGGPDSGPAEAEAEPTEEYISDLPSAPGYVLREDGPGFNIAVPEGWDREEKEDSVFFNSPDGKSLMQIIFAEFRDEPYSTPHQDLLQTSQYLARERRAYKEISRGDCAYMPGGAQLVYAYDLTDGSRRKVVDCAFTEHLSAEYGGGVQYQVLVAGPQDDWPLQSRILRTALKHFGQW
ncbi:hypothetical protein ACGFWG_32280 [Streptomyces sp. NPDC048405]|uniref:hypothetical protein n=1 Tax=Streptomyces sp. NPDC048405 TaxID=3365544 RepID=UPI003714E827